MCAWVEDGAAVTRRETTVGDVTVRAASIDVRTCGAGGGSIAHVPELTKALRVGPESAGAVPGPAAYANGGEEPTVTTLMWCWVTYRPSKNLAAIW